MTEDRERKKKLWDIDPTMFRKREKATFFRSQIEPTLRQLGKFILLGLAITYPFYLVYVGIAYGGIAFWAFFAGSFALIGFIITRLGFAGNFRNWDIDGKRLIGLALGFILAVGFYAGLIYLKIWMVPIGVLATGIGVFFLQRTRSR